MRPAAVAAAAVAVAVICAGCLGGGSGSSGSASYQLTHAEYVAKAGAVCSSYRKRIAALPTPSDLQKLADSGERAIELQRQEVAELRRLAPPAADAADVNRMLEAVERGIAAGEQLVAAARTNDAPAVAAAAQSLQSALEPANRIARKLDLGACAITA